MNAVLGVGRIWTQLQNLTVAYETLSEVYTNSLVFVSDGFFWKQLGAAKNWCLLVDLRFEEQLFMIKDAVFNDSSAQLHL